MDVILTQDVKSLGKKGQKVSVSDGYARNFLIPKGLASKADAQALNVLKSREEAAAYKKAEELKTAKLNAEKLNGRSVKVIARGNADTGKLFGAVTPKEIAEELEKQYGVSIDKRKITVSEIKSFGTYDFDIKLHSEISVKMYVTVCE